MLVLFAKENRTKLNQLVSLMLPILGTQLANMGMGFFDASMSGQAGNVDLAGSAIGSNLWAPIHTGLGGILLAALPLIANALGAGEREKIIHALRQGLLLAFCFSLLLLLSGPFWLPWALAQMSLTPDVYYIAQCYCYGVAIGILPFFLIIPVRSLVDSLGYTELSMKLYLLGLPLNAFLNYIFIFGKLGLPRFGGIGAGIATGITYWLLFFLFFFVVRRMDVFQEYRPFSLEKPNLKAIKEYLRLGIPLGFSIFLEVSIFCIVAFFIAKFGTNVLAAHEAAMNLTCLIYMVPLSFSMALTIMVGRAYGAKDYTETKLISRLGIELNVACSLVYMSLEFLCLDYLTLIYSSDPEVRLLLKEFVFYALIWQFADTLATPAQGVLRGYKDVDATFWSNVGAYWGVCLPLGLLLDYHYGRGAFAYWEGLLLGVFLSMTFLVLRMFWFEAKYLKQPSTD